MIRFLRSHLGYASMATAILALAMGINLLVFSVVNALWLRPLPVAEPARVVTILGYGSTFRSLDSPTLKVFDGPVAGQVVTTGLYEAFRTQIGFPQTPQPLETLGVTPLYFSVLGVPVRGRAFIDADERAGAEGVAIISDEIWASAFDRGKDVIGAVVPATPRPLRIVGIAPPRFFGARRGEHTDLWVPTRVVGDLAPADRQISSPGMMVFTRLHPGQTVAALEQEFRDRRILPDSIRNTPDSPIIAPLTEVFGTSDSPSMLIRESGTLSVVFGLSLLVLLGGCATVAALMLTHYERRRPELAIKAWLGASRVRLVRELTSELLAVGLGGSVSAMMCGLLGARLLPALSLPGGVNLGRLDLSLDWRFALTAFVATIVTLAAAGAVPLWKVTHARLAGEVATGPVQTTVSALRTRHRLLALQASATTVVLIASGLFVHTVLYSFRGAAGFNIDHTVFVSVQERPVGTASDLRAVPRIDFGAIALARRAQLSDLFSSLPLVRAVAGGTAPVGPDALAGNPPLWRTITVGEQKENLLVGVLSGTPNLLTTLGVPLLAGRPLSASDAATMEPLPVIMTRSLAERLWPSGDALGQTFASQPRFPRECVVVGISSDFAFGTLSRAVGGVLVIARGDYDYRVSNMVLQADDPQVVVAAIPKLLPDRVVRVATGRDVVGRDIGQQRLGAWAFSGFGLVALLLAAGGVYGLVTYLVQARRREFGVRMALGATLSDIIRGAVSAALKPVAVGVGVGLLFGVIGSRLFAALLVGINGLDPSTYGGVGVVMLVPASLAALAAASKLRTLSPSDALRRD
jgi:predicted permease